MTDDIKATLNHILETFSEGEDGGVMVGFQVLRTIAADHARLEEENKALIEELECHEEEACSVDDELELRAAEIDRLKAKVERLTGALEYYADHNNWTPVPTEDDVEMWQPPVSLDQGDKARAALSKDTDDG